MSLTLAARPKVAKTRKPLDLIDPLQATTEALNERGWKARAIDTSKNRTEGAKVLSTTQFVNPSRTRLIDNDAVETVWPEVIVTDAGRLAGAYRVRLGLYDLDTEDVFVVAHAPFTVGKRSTDGEIAGMVESIQDMMADAFVSREAMMGRTMTPMEKGKFAARAMALRVDKDAKHTTKHAELLAVDDGETEPKTVWDTFNVIRRNLLSGNYNLYTGEVGRKARPISDMIVDLELNEELWGLANSYVK